MEPRERRRLVIPGPLDECFEGGFLAVGEIGGIAVRDRGPAGPQDAVEVGGEEGRAVGIRTMECEEAAVELHGVEQRRIEIGDRLVSLGLPGEEVVERAEHRTGGIQFEGVFGSDHAAFTRRRKVDGVADDHVPDGGPVGVGLFPRLDDRRPVGHRQGLQRLAFVAARCADGHGEPLFDLADDARQIPLGDGRQIIRLGAPGRSLLKPPTVLHEEAPRPVGADRLQHAAGFGRCRVDRGRQKDEPLGIVTGAVDRLRQDPGGDRTGDLRP